MDQRIDAHIDPRLHALVLPSRAFYADRPARRGPADLHELTTARDNIPPPTPSEPPARVVQIRSDDRHVMLRLHEPADRPAVGVVLNIHGGGFYLGSAAAQDVRNQRLADDLGLVVASVDYRLAPEHPWPAAPDDCEIAALWLVEEFVHTFGASGLALMGASAGATLAMTTLIRLRDKGIRGFTSAVLQFGTYDLSGTTPSGRLFADEYSSTRTPVPPRIVRTPTSPLRSLTYAACRRS